MDRRGFVTSGVAAGLVGLGGAAPFARALTDGGIWRVGKTRADGTLRLSSNENPLGLPPAARQAVLDHLLHANRYPGEWAAPLQQALAERLGVKADCVVPGQGSTEILQMAVQAFHAPGAPLVLADPTFEHVARYQDPLAYDLRPVPLGAGWGHDVERMRQALGPGGGPGLVYICNPGNPTGTLTPSRDLDAWIADAPETTIFLVDEAYFEYTRHPDYWSALKWVESRPNVVVVRTFSKIFAMAGLRLGYGVAHPSTAERLRDFACANNVNLLAAAAGMACLADDDFEARSLEVNDQALAIAVEVLDELELEHMPTHANFIMHRVNGALPAYITRMREVGIRVGRPFPPLDGWNRVSFGLPEEMERWADNLRRLRRTGHA